MQVRVEQSTEGKAIVPTAAEVRDVNVPVAACLVLAPLEQSISL